MPNYPCSDHAGNSGDGVSDRPRDWLEALRHCRLTQAPCVLVTLIDAAGPRGAGVKMTVTADAIGGTIGGGGLEHWAMQQARSLLASAAGLTIADYRPDRDEHCGGAARVLFEPIRPAAWSIVVCGAGHVGQALIHVLAPLPCRITWIDPRAALLPRQPPANVQTVASGNPVETIAQAPAASDYLLMSPSHQQDFELCAAILRRGDYRYLGMIGSQRKRQQCADYLRGQGFAPADWERLRCPLGLQTIRSREPAAIAIAIGAELLEFRDAGTAAR